MATAAATSSSISNTHSPRFRRNSRGHSRDVRAESDVAVDAVAPPSPTSEPSFSPLQPDGADRHEDVVIGNAAPFDSAKEKEKKSAWNKPSANGVIEVVGPLMGAVSWPALSESTKASPKPSSSADLLPIVTTSAATTSTTPSGGPLVADGSVSSPQLDSINPRQGSVVASPALPKPMVSTPNPSPSVNHAPTRQKSMKRGGGGGNSSIDHTGGGFVNGGSVPPSSPSTLEPSKMASDNKPVAQEQSPRDSPSRNSSNWEHGPRSGGFSSQTHGGFEYHRSYSGQHRRGNNNGGGTDGGSHHNYNTRRNHDRGNYEWNGHRNFTSRDVQLQQPHHSQRVHQRPFPIPPVVSGSVPYISPSPAVQPFRSHMGYPDMSGVVYLPAPYVAPPPQLIYHIPDPQLHNVLLKQIEYYFSFDNLCKDIFLRQNMDDEGWVSVSVIADFNRVKQLTTDVGFILNTLHASSIIEVQGDKIRKRNDWMNWLLPPPVNNQFSCAPSVESSEQATYDALAARLEKADINESCLGAAQSDMLFGSPSSAEELNSQSEVTRNPTDVGLGKFQAE